MNQKFTFYGFVKLVVLIFFLQACAAKKPSMVSATYTPEKSKEIISPPKTTEATTPTPTYSSNVIVYDGAMINTIISSARSYLGTPYLWGGMSKKGIDCSGLIFNAYLSVGITIPRVAWQQAHFGKEVAVSEIKKGDWVFFNTNKTDKYLNHAAIVTEVRGPKEIIFIQSSGSKGVCEENLFSANWRKMFDRAVRPFAK